MADLLRVNSSCRPSLRNTASNRVGQEALTIDLSHYAQNMWRRFPEVFLSLGAPDLEDNFELRGSPCRQCVIDMGCEKVIEIRLLRRNADREHRVNSTGVASGFGSPQPRRSEDWGDAFSITELGRGLHTPGKEETVVEAIEAQSCSMDSLRHRALDDKAEEKQPPPATPPKCKASRLRVRRVAVPPNAQTHRCAAEAAGSRCQPDQFGREECSIFASPRPFSSRGRVRQHIAVARVQQPLPPPQAATADIRVSWLAIRRGLPLSNVQTQDLGEKTPGCVIRRPELDRIAGVPVSLCSATDATETTNPVPTAKQQVASQLEEDGESCPALRR